MRKDVKAETTTRCIQQVLGKYFISHTRGAAVLAGVIGVHARPLCQVQLGGENRAH